MKTTKFISALFAIFALAFLSTLESCTKDSETEPSSVSKSSLLTSEGWVTNAGTMTFAGQTIDIMDSKGDCEKDDILYFKSDETTFVDEGALKCDPADPQTRPGGKWAFNSDQTSVVITDSTDVTELDVTTLTSSTLVLEFNEYDSTFQSNIVMKITYKH